jgi:hypothetical protein
VITEVEGRTPVPPIQPSREAFCIFVPLYRYDKHVPWYDAGWSRTSTSFLLREELALSSIGVYPANLAQRCALVVLPIPGGPVIMAFFPGFLKPA